MSDFYLDTTVTINNARRYTCGSSIISRSPLAGIRRLQGSGCRSQARARAGCWPDPVRWRALARSMTQLVAPTPCPNALRDNQRNGAARGSMGMADSRSRRRWNPASSFRVPGVIPGRPHPPLGRRPADKSPPIVLHTAGCHFPQAGSPRDRLVDAWRRFEDGRPRAASARWRLTSCTSRTPENVGVNRGDHLWRLRHRTAETWTVKNLPLS